MKRDHSQYPDIADILAQKNLGRKKRGQLSFAQKLDALDALRERVAPLVHARTARIKRKPRLISSQ
jgi:hypothetical protein